MQCKTPTSTPASSTSAWHLKQTGSVCPNFFFLDADDETIMTRRYVLPLLLSDRHHLVSSCCPSSSSLVLQLLHSVEGGAGLEPFDLCLVEAVEQLQGFLAAVAVLHNSVKRLEDTSGRGGFEWFLFFFPSPS